VALTAEQLRSALRHAISRQSEAGARVMARLSPAPVLSRLREAATKVESLGARLESVSYQKTLERGFVLVTTPAGAALTTAGAVKPGASLRLRFADGTVAATADRLQGKLPF
jgi:exodeoxyribonuclease VII large subunit